MCATRSATATSTRSARRSRSAGAAAGRSTSPTSTTARPTRAALSRCSALVDDARAEGLDVTFDCYPYEWASTRLLIQLPLWIQDGGPRPLKERLADSLRARAAARRSSPRGAPRTRPRRAGPMFAWATSPRRTNLRWEGTTLADVMAERGVDAVDAMCDLLLAENLRVNQVTSGPWTKTLHHFVVHPVGMFGTDSTFIGAKPSPRTYGSYPARAGRVRARARAAGPRGGRPQDDVRARGAAGPRRIAAYYATATRPTS